MKELYESGMDKLAQTRRSDGTAVSFGEFAFWLDLAAVRDLHATVERLILPPIERKAVARLIHEIHPVLQMLELKFIRLAARYSRAGGRG